MSLTTLNVHGLLIFFFLLLNTLVVAHRTEFAPGLSVRWAPSPSNALQGRCRHKGSELLRNVAAVVMLVGPLDSIKDIPHTTRSHCSSSCTCIWILSQTSLLFKNHFAFEDVCCFLQAHADDSTTIYFFHYMRSISTNAAASADKTKRTLFLPPFSCLCIF